MISTKQLRESFINFFKAREHTNVASSSLIPFQDDTLLFTNAGMVQFKDTFLGLEKRDYKKAVTVQKCLRAGGKHNDLDNVGYTSRHHTFFEMLGNFSFGDYFKKEAIQYAWDFITKEIKLPKEKLWVTVHTTDNESFNIWKKEIGLESHRVIKINSDDNFWSMGDTGPCGPCTEIFYDHGEHIEGGLPGTEQEDGDRYIEIWNIVFMQYNRSSDGTIENLPKPSVDTGMGIERLSAILQNVNSNYDIDLFQSLIKDIAKIIKINNLESASLKVIADHIRACSFLIADGVLPSNEGSGYVLRRIIRRAVRHGNKLGAKEIFFYKIVNSLIKEMGEAYPQLIEKRELIENTLKKEEILFTKTVEKGIKIFEIETKNIKEIIPGDLVFKLYDTYGFPVDLTADMAREKGLKIDEKSFKSEMQKQKQRSKKSNKFDIDYNTAIKTNAETLFKGYSTDISDAKILEVYVNGDKREHITENEKAVIILDKTPFYAEAGGQISDSGIIESVGSSFEIQDIKKVGNAILHIGKLTKGKISVNDEVTAIVNSEDRLAISANHSSTHLLHSALQKVIGNHAEQKGSLVNAQRLRFDYSNDKALTKQEIINIENLVNNAIRANYYVDTIETTLEKAQTLGAKALFGEKYDDIVRVVCMGDFSVELCGGTHVKQTGDIGLFKILSDSGISSGVRRIEAVTSKEASKYLNNLEDIINNANNLLKSNNANLLEKLSNLQELVKTQEKQIAKLKKDLISGSNSIDEKEHNGIKIVTAIIPNSDMKTLREKIDDYKSKSNNVVIALATVVKNKVQFAIGIGKSTTKLIKAGDIAKELTSYIDGKGGGRADMAQGGGNNPTNLENGIKAIQEYIFEKLNN